MFQWTQWRLPGMYDGVGFERVMASMAGVDARTHVTHAGGAKTPPEPGQRVLRIERQEEKRSTTMRQSVEKVRNPWVRGLTLDDESAMNGFGLGGLDEARRRRARVVWQKRVGCIPFLTSCKEGRITPVAGRISRHHKDRSAFLARASASKSTNVLPAQQPLSNGECLWV
ncbi:uncharacterized protein Z518_06862 [Rhinocladiella mackenziei CBS 650.93]|uniref:Uncharacterized protein n=1 Tax=Rhinocladiella mackenziei CBS 650.93 TaxID=1442369 RepID=A0A0D2J2V9_9EURO|nr:uncharacterized protein Z518_06862 [Rhinocladiella mackenziei CBS 650.93]KIX03310.1 hypothetical protein Z518_06862 [Rhinocladiella mackenziei CBS 650.93]